MPYPTLTFDELLTQLPGGLENRPAQAMKALNAAARWAWTYFNSWSLPHCLDSGEVTLGAGSIVDASDIDDSPHWSFWESDPRTRASTISLASLHLVARSVAGDVVLPDKAAGDTVYAFWQKPIPVWSGEDGGADTLPTELATAVVLYAEYHSLRGEANLIQNSREARARAIEEIESLALRHCGGNANTQPWLVNDQGVFN